MPKSNKRAAPTTTTRTKRLRAEVHPLQEKLAERTAAKVRQSRDSAGIIIATRMGKGKPRIVGKVLDRIVPEKIDALDEDEAIERGANSVLTIIVVTDAKHGREQATQYGTDFPGPYHASDLDPLLRCLNMRQSARIMIPFATFRKMCYGTKPTQTDIWALLNKIKTPEVILVIDEVHEVYKAANSRLTRAVDAIRTRYKTLTGATMSVLGMSGTPSLENATYAARASTLFGTDPTTINFTEAEEQELCDAINPQDEVSSRENTNEVLPTPEETHEDSPHPLKVLSTLVVGNALFHDIRGDSVVKKHVGELMVQQILGCDQDGGLLFQKLAEGSKAPMFKVNKKGAIGETAKAESEAVVVATDSPYGTQALYDSLEELQERSDAEGELRAFTVHDLRLDAQIKATKEADKVPHEWLKCDVADQKAALKAFLAAAAKQDGSTAIAIIDKRQALSGTNDFAKNVQRAVAIGAWEQHEVDQFNARLGRACELKEGDLVPKVFYGVHLYSPFAANLVAPAKERAADKALLTEEAKEALAKLKTTVKKDEFRKAEDAAEVLAATGLPGDPALKYLECLDGEETFKVTEYMPLITHHADCEGEEETDEAAEVKKTITKCCKACKFVFSKAGEGEEEDE